MERLGYDVLTSICNKIHNKVDLKSFMKVSKLFMRVACIRLIELHNSFPGFLYDILPASPNLKNLSCFKPLSNTHMKLLAQSCPKLRYFVLYSQARRFDFDDDSLCAVANSCRDLIRVDIGRSIHVGDVGIHSLITSCKNLRRLDLNGCFNITDESLKAIGQATNLQYLHLKGCYLITDLGLEYLANGTVKDCLEFLDLGECDRISDDGIIYLKQIVTLKRLFLTNCGWNVTNIGVMSLLSQLPNIMMSW